MTHYLLNYAQKMRNGGFRVTSQRKIILDAICESGHGASVEQILRRLRKKSPSLDRATVYRNLNFLQKLHLIYAAGDGKNKRFEIASLEPHLHLICRECGYEAGLDCKYTELLTSMIQKEFDFTIDNHHLSFQGLCALCSSGKSRKSKRIADKPKQG